MAGKTLCNYFCNFWWLHRINMFPHSFLNQCLHCYGCYVNKTLNLFQVSRNVSRVVMISSQLLFFRVEIANVWRQCLPWQCKSLYSFLWSLDLASLSFPSTEPWEVTTKQELPFKICCNLHSQLRVHYTKLSDMGCVCIVIAIFLADITSLLNFTLFFYLLKKGFFF